MNRRAPSGWSLAAVTYAFTTVMMGTTLPTPLYPAYEAQYHFGSLTTTILFAVYAVGVIGALVLFGQASNRFGRRPVLVAGVVVSLLSAILFITADAMWVLYVARIVSGVSAGIFTATGTAAVMENAPKGRTMLASALATAANIGGLGLGVLLAGVLAATAATPLRTPYIVHAGLLVIAGLAMFVVRETIERRPDAPVVRLPRVPREARPVFRASAIGALTGFASCGIYTSIVPAFMTELLDVHDPATIGFVAFLLFGASATAQILFRSRSERTLITIGCISLVIGMALMATALLTSLLWVLIAAAVLAGIGQGSLFMGGMRAVTSRTPAESRTEATTSFFLVAYVAISVPIVTAGLLTQVLSLTTTGLLCAGAIGVATLLALPFLGRFSRDRG
ncbi:MFS family permease [Pseudoclavibacter chungangensis]|nr:MFS transporter [Pseudoclavibacter chungangensis]NYJ68716.1 MFS family permease [Pseudoclavibacter chungangensis]